MVRKLALLSVLVLALSLTAQAQEKVTLKTKLPPGTFTMSINNDMTVNVDMGTDQKMEQKQNMLIVMEVNAGALEGDEQKATMEFKRIKQVAQVGPMEITYDSADPNAESPLAGIFKPMLSAKVEFVLDAKGKIKSVTGLDKIFEEMAKQNPALANMTKQMKDQMGEGMLKQSLGGDQFLPKEPVAKGETWTTEVDGGMGMMGVTGKMVNNCKLLDIESTPGGQVAVIEVKGKMTGKGGDAKAAIPGATIESIDMQTDGTVRLNIKTGLIEKGEANLKGSIAMGAAAPDGQQGMKLNMTLGGKVSQATVEGKYVAPKIEPKPAPQPEKPADF